MPSNTAILAIDTATGPCSVAVWAGGRVASYREHLKPQSQSAVLMPMVESALAEAKIGYQDLSAVASTIGPGSFTGIRVGLAVARGIALSSGIPGIGYTTLEVMAAGARTQEKLLTLLNAGKGEVYYQLWQNGKALGDIALATLEQLFTQKPALVAANVPVPGVKLVDIHFPRADALAQLAAMRSSSVPLVPFYLREPDAKLPAKKL